MFFSVNPQQSVARKFTYSFNKKIHKGNICEAVTHKNRNRRSYRRQPTDALICIDVIVVRDSGM